MSQEKWLGGESEKPLLMIITVQDNIGNLIHKMKTNCAQKHFTNVK